MTTRLFLALAFFLLPGCPSPLPTPQGTLEPAPPTPSAPYEARCKSACEKQRALSCPRGFPSSKGDACETVCENTYANGLDFRAECLAQATDCSPCR